MDRARKGLRPLGLIATLFGCAVFSASPSYADEPCVEDEFYECVPVEGDEFLYDGIYLADRRRRRRNLRNTRPPADDRDRPPSDPREAYEHAVGADDGYTYIARGVASDESDSALDPDTDDNGRVHGREHYGIQDEDVRPGFILNDSENPLDEDDRYFVLRDMQFYAQQGEAAQEAAEDGRDLTPRDASSLYPDAMGDIIIYRVPEDSDLDRYPQSNVSRPGYVVGVPDDAEVWGVIPGPTTVGDDGYPEYPDGTPETEYPSAGDGDADDDGEDIDPNDVAYLGDEYDYVFGDESDDYSDYDLVYDYGYGCSYAVDAASCI